jgi:hypothetical protein
MINRVLSVRGLSCPAPGWKRRVVGLAVVTGRTRILMGAAGWSCPAASTRRRSGTA